MHGDHESPLFFRLLGGATLFFGVATTTLVSRKSSHLNRHLSNSPPPASPNWLRPSQQRRAEMRLSMLPVCGCRGPRADASGRISNSIACWAGRRRIAQATGSGVLVDKSWIIVTNHHVIQGARGAREHLRRQIACGPCGGSHKYGLAVLAISGPSSRDDHGQLRRSAGGRMGARRRQPLEFDLHRDGWHCQCQGRNIRLLEADASREVFPVESFLQTDAAVNPGNSGGARESEGQLIGINTAIASRQAPMRAIPSPSPPPLSPRSSRTFENLVGFSVYMGIQVRPANPVVVALQVLAAAHGAGIEVVIAFWPSTDSTWAPSSSKATVHTDLETRFSSRCSAGKPGVVVVTLTNRQGASRSSRRATRSPPRLHHG